MFPVMTELPRSLVHRIAPAPVGSGISTRKLPAPSLSDLRKICNHYERKAGGKYASDSRAARSLSNDSTCSRAIDFSLI